MITIHTANYLVSKFLNSKRSLKKIYRLRNSHITILRYICDSIDMNFSKTKRHSTKIYQSQIATYSRNSERTVRQALKHLIKKRLIKTTGKSTYSIGKVLTLQAPLAVKIKQTPATTASTIDTGNHCRSARWRQPLPVSNLTNIYNRDRKQLPVDNFKRRYPNKINPSITFVQRESDNFHRWSPNGEISPILANYLKEMSCSNTNK